jgi:CRP-like cAMP-binding protein
MRTSPLFRPFDDAERTQLVARFRFLEIDAGTAVLTPGTRPDGLYIVLAGQLTVIRDGAVAALLGPGELIGETALLSGGKVQSEVAAKTKVLALCLPAAEFREVIMTHPHVLEYIGEQAEKGRRLRIL